MYFFVAHIHCPEKLWTSFGGICVHQVGVTCLFFVVVVVILELEVQNMIMLHLMLHYLSGGSPDSATVLVRNNTAECRGNCFYICLFSSS